MQKVFFLTLLLLANEVFANCESTLGFTENTFDLDQLPSVKELESDSLSQSEFYWGASLGRPLLLLKNISDGKYFVFDEARSLRWETEEPIKFLTGPDNSNHRIVITAKNDLIRLGPEFGQYERIGSLVSDFDPYGAAAVSPSGNFLVLGNSNNRISIKNLEHENSVTEVTLPTDREGWITDLAFISETEVLAVSQYSLFKVRIPDGTLLEQLRLPINGSARNLKIHDNRVYITGPFRKVIEAATRELRILRNLKKTPDHFVVGGGRAQLKNDETAFPLDVHDLIITPDGRKLMLAYDHNDWGLFEYNTFEPITMILGERGRGAEWVFNAFTDGSQVFLATRQMTQTSKARIRKFSIH